MAGGKYTLEVQGTLNDAKIRAQLEKLNNYKADFGGKGMANVTKEAKKANTGLMAMGKTFASNTKKVAMFGASTALLGAFTAGVGKAVQNVFDLDKSLTELKKVSDLQGDSLKKYTDQAFEAGKTVAKTGTEMVDAATEFKKSGWNEQDALVLGTVAAKYTNIADTEVSTAEASKFLISQIKAFNIEAKDSEHIIDATNETANNFAVGTNDLSTALTKASSGLGTVGNSFEETIGLVTAGTEVMVSQPAKVGRGMRSIALNIAQLSKESDTWTAANGKVSVSLKDQEGNMRSTYDIMKDLHTGVEGQSVAWEDLSNSEKTAIAQQAAGKNQFEVFTSVMGNFENAVNATNTALNSSGSAQKENEKSMDSLAGHMQQLRSAFEYFTYKTINSDFIKSLIDAGTALMKFLGSDVGQATLQFSLIGAGVLGLVKTFMKLKSAVSGLSVLDAFKTLIVGTDALKQSANNVDDVADAVDDVADAATKGAPAIASLGTTLGVLGGLAAIGGILYAVKKAMEYGDELTATYNATKDKIIENSAEMESLKANADNLTAAEKERLDILIRQNEELKKQATIEASSALEEETGKGTGIGAEEGSVADATFEDFKSRNKIISDTIQKQKDLNKAYLDGSVSLDDYRKGTKENNELVATASKETEKMSKKYNDAADAGVKLSDDQKELKKSVDDGLKTLKDYNSLGKGEDTEKIAAMFPNASELAKTSEGMATLKDRATTLISAISGGKKGFQDFKSMMGDIEGGYKDLGKYDKKKDVFTFDNANIKDYAKSLNISTEYAEELLKTQTKSGKIKWDIPNKDIQSFNTNAKSLTNTLDRTDGTFTASRDDLVKLGQSLNIPEAAIPSFIKGFKDAGNSVINLSSKTPELIQQLSATGDQFGITMNKAGTSIQKVDVQGLTEGLVGLGATQDQVTSVFQSLAEMDGVEIKGDWGDFITGSATAEEAAKQLYEQIKKTGKADAEPEIKAKGAKKAKKDVKEVKKDVDSLGKSKAKPTISEKGSKKTQKSVKKTKKDVESLDDTEGKAKLDADDNTQPGVSSAEGNVGSFDGTTWEAYLQALNQTQPGLGVAVAMLSGFAGTPFIATLASQDNATPVVSGAENKANSFAKNYSASLSARDQASGTIGYINSLLNSINGKTAVTYIKTIESTQKKAKGKIKGEVGGTAWVGDEGSKSNPKPELVETKNGAYLAGTEGWELVNLDRDDTVHTASETKRLLAGKFKGMFEDGIIPRFAKGRKKSKKHAKSDSKAAKRYTSKQEALEHQLDINKISEKTYIKRLKKITKYTKVSTDQWRSYEKTYFDYVNKKQTESLDKKVDSLDAEKGFTQKTLDSVKKAVKKAYKSRKITLDQYKEYNAKIQDAIAEKNKKIQEDLQEKEEERYNKLAEKQDARRQLFEIYADKQKDAIQERIDALEKEKDAQDEVNEAKERANNLAEKEQALTEAKSKKLKVYREGVGFVYESDIQEIANAQKELDDLKAEYASEDAEKERTEALDKQIEELEKQQKAWEDYINAENQAEEIKQLEKLAGTTFGSLTKGLQEQITQAFKDQYNTAGELMHAYEDIANAVASGTIKINKKTGIVDSKTLQAYINKNKYADGTTSAKGGLSLVGERGSELRLLNSGDGIIPADMTRNLQEIGKYSLRDLINVVDTNSGSNQSVVQYNFGQGSIVVNGDNGEALAKDIMSNMQRLAHQKTSVRR